jgi:hypothetical protein
MLIMLNYVMQLNKGAGRPGRVGRVTWKDLVVVLSAYNGIFLQPGYDKLFVPPLCAGVVLELLDVRLPTLSCRSSLFVRGVRSH